MKRGKKSNPSTMSQKAVIAMMHRQGFRCAYTGEPLADDASLDHKLPVSRGGTHEENNLALVGGRVNSAKGNATVEEFVSMCKAVANHLGDGVAATPIPDVTAGEISGCTDPVEILTRLGYIEAASIVVEMKGKISSFGRSRVRFNGKVFSADDLIEEKKKVIDELDTTIWALRRNVAAAKIAAKSSEMRPSLTNWKGEDAT